MPNEVNGPIYRVSLRYNGRSESKDYSAADFGKVSDEIESRFSGNYTVSRINSIDPASVSDDQDYNVTVEKNGKLVSQVISGARLRNGGIDEIKNKFATKRKTVIDNVEEAVYVEKEIEDNSSFIIDKNDLYAYTFESPSAVQLNDVKGDYW